MGISDESTQFMADFSLPFHTCGDENRYWGHCRRQPCSCRRFAYSVLAKIGYTNWFPRSQEERECRKGRVSQRTLDGYARARFSVNLLEPPPAFTLMCQPSFKNSHRDNSIR